MSGDDNPRLTINDSIDDDRGQSTVQQDIVNDVNDHHQEKTEIIEPPINDEEPGQQPPGKDMSKQDMINEITRLKQSISLLTSNIRDTRTVVEKYDNDNQYLQDYVGTLMKNNELKK